MEWILYDCFEDLRATDRILADECLEPTFDFQTEDYRKHVKQLGSYLEYRRRDVG